MSATNFPIRTWLGSLVVGCYFGLFLSGVVAMQAYFYYKVYPRDASHVKALVALIWLLDFLHTVMTCNANWMNVIVHYGETDQIDHINWSVATTVALTALVTFIVHCFFIHRIYLLSRGNKILTYLLSVIALFRLGAATVSTSEMIRLSSYTEFVKRYSYVFTMGLGSALALDVLITSSLIFYLSRSRSSFSSMNDVIDTLILYTIETGMTTCIVTLASLACWLTMPQNLVFLGLHFTISKLYANSLLATLNSRATLRARQTSSDREADIPIPMVFTTMDHRRIRPNRSHGTMESKQLHISVEKSVHTRIDNDFVVRTNSPLPHGKSNGSSGDIGDTEISSVEVSN